MFNRIYSDGESSYQIREEIQGISGKKYAIGPYGSMARCISNFVDAQMASKISEIIQLLTVNIRPPIISLSIKRVGICIVGERYQHQSPVQELI